MTGFKRNKKSLFRLKPVILAVQPICSSTKHFAVLRQPLLQLPNQKRRKRTKAQIKSGLTLVELKTHLND